MTLHEKLERDNLLRFDRIYYYEKQLNITESLPLTHFIRVDESEFLRINGFTFSVLSEQGTYNPQGGPESWEIQIRDVAQNAIVVGQESQGRGVPVLRLKDVSPTYLQDIALVNPQNRQLPGAVLQPFMVKRIFGPKSLIEIQLNNTVIGQAVNCTLRIAFIATAFRREA